MTWAVKGSKEEPLLRCVKRAKKYGTIHLTHSFIFWAFFIYNIIFILN